MLEYGTNSDLPPNYISQSLHESSQYASPARHQYYHHQPEQYSQAGQQQQHHHHIIARHAQQPQAASHNQSIGLIDSLLANLTTSLLTAAQHQLEKAAGVSVYESSSVPLPPAVTVATDNVDKVSLQLVSATMSSPTDGNLGPAAGSSAVVQVTGPEPRNYSSYEELELLSANWQIVLVIVYSLTAAIALVGNVIAIWVLVSGKRSSKELRLFLVNLSLADITMALFSIPFTYTDFMLGRWIFTPSFCPIVQLMQMTSVFVSVYTLTAIGIDRYIAIIYPLLSARFSRSFGSLTILGIWVAGFTLGFVQWANTRAIPFYIADEINYDCKEMWSSDQSMAFTFSVFIITFALPMCVLVYVYGSVAWTMFRHSTPGNADLARDRAQHSSKIKIIKMLATIVILFAICWLPLHILNLFIYFARDLMVNIYNSSVGFNMYVTVAITAHWFSMSNSFVNPIIYCFMSENFRSDLRALLRKCLRRSSCYHKNVLHRRRRRSNTNSRMYTVRSSASTCRTSIFATTSTKTNASCSSNNSINKIHQNCVTGAGTVNGYRLAGVSRGAAIPGLDKPPASSCTILTHQWSHTEYCAVPVPLLSAGSMPAVDRATRPTANLSANGQTTLHRDADCCCWPYESANASSDASAAALEPDQTEPTVNDAFAEAKCAAEQAAAVVLIPSMTSPARVQQHSGSGGRAVRPSRPRPNAASLDQNSAKYCLASYATACIEQQCNSPLPLNSSVPFDDDLLRSQTSQRHSLTDDDQEEDNCCSLDPTLRPLVTSGSLSVS